MEYFDQRKESSLSETLEHFSKDYCDCFSQLYDALFRELGLEKLNRMETYYTVAL